VSEPNHAALLAGVKAGHPNYEEIFRAYRPAMYKAALAVFGSRQRSVRGRQAQDAVQAAMLEVFRKELLTPKISNIVGLLVTVTTRRALEMVRPTKTRIEPTAEIATVAGAVDEDPFAVVEEGAAARQVLLGAMDHLMEPDIDENERRVFTQIYRLGRTIPEAAKELGISEPGVRNIRKRVLSKLARKLGIEPEMEYRHGAAKTAGGTRWART
jgi:RNA polymerase sigma factor (sigma-70 family)